MELQDTSGSTKPLSAEQWIEQLDALQPSKQQQRMVLFQTLYPAIERALARDVPQKAIIAQLKERGLSLSVGGFRSMLEAERKQYAEKGERLRCECCGSSLPVTVEATPQKSVTTLIKTKEAEAV